MERIVIEVGENTARQWRFASQKRREEIAQKIEIKLAKELMIDQKQEFILYLDELRKTMKSRGLTEEILQELLKDD
jgi:phosphotransacetylase